MQCCVNINCFEQGRICVPDTGLPRIVVIGGGFAGLNLVKGLKNLPVQVVLIDKNNFHHFLPLLYQVATTGRFCPKLGILPESCKVEQEWRDHC